MPMPYPAPTQPAEADCVHLMLAYTELRRRGYHCVLRANTLDDLLACGGIGAALVRNHASLLQRGLPRFVDAQAPVTHRPQVLPPEPPIDEQQPLRMPLRRPQQPTHSGHHRPALFDPKRAAAGDRDEA